MKRRAFVGCCTAAALGALPAARAAAVAPVAPGQAVPWPELPLLDGSRFGAAQAADHAVVVVFWRIGCPFCRRHLPRIERLHRAAAGRALRVLAVARERDPALVGEHARQQGYSFAITLADELLAPLLATRPVVPMTVVVDRRGRLKQSLPGEMAEDDVMGLLQLADPETRT